MNGADRRMETRDPNESGSSQSASENYDGIGPKRYSYDQLARVTGHFSDNNLIGRGGFGRVYKASLDGEIRAIKKLDSPSEGSQGDLEREIMVVKSVSHRNLVELVGCCVDGADKLLILKYFSNGSLRSKLHGKEHILDWKKRMNIAIGSARGLEYLHEHCKPKIIHLDIKPDNILLDENFEPLITDFGLAQFFTDGATHISKSSVMGTHVYEDPWTTKKGKYSDKSDIYSFGVTLLELITGRKSMDNGIDIVTWANHRIKKALEGRYTNFVDSNLQSFDQEQMHRMVSCVNSCLIQIPNSRPTMEKIRLVLEGKSPPEELYDHELQWSIIHEESSSYFEEDDQIDSYFEEDDQIEESSSYSEEDDQIEESSSLYEKNYMSIFEPKPNSLDELVLANYKGGAKPYSYFELAKATNYFSLNNLLAQGRFGDLFIASFDGKIRAVKKINHYVQSEVDFAWEIMVLNGIRHKNLVKLVGYCIDGSNRLLISKYFPNKSLRYQLHGNKNVLDWKKRMNIAIGSARGLEYLHEYSNLKIIHLYITSDNILLDDDFEPKISDFGRAATHVFRSSTFGTHIYADSPTVKLEKYSNKSDVYSFGVILLELITGRKVMIRKNINIDIVTWVKPLIKKALEGEYMDFVDSRLQFFDDQEMHRMIFCANACINQPLGSRPSMKMILLALEGNFSLDSLTRDE